MEGAFILSHRRGVFLHVFLAASSINRSALRCQPRKSEAASGSECRRLSFSLAPGQAQCAKGQGVGQGRPLLLLAWRVPLLLKYLLLSFRW